MNHPSWVWLELFYELDLNIIYVFDFNLGKCISFKPKEQFNHSETYSFEESGGSSIIIIIIALKLPFDLRHSFDIVQLQNWEAKVKVEYVTPLSCGLGRVPARA